MSNKVKTILIVSGGLVVILGGLFIFLSGDDNQPQTLRGELVFWGVFEDSEVIKPLINDFNEVHPKLKIRYFEKNYQTYENDILEAMAAGGGPDIFMIHHTWLSRYTDKIWAAPLELLNLKYLQDNFVDVVADDFVREAYVYALPLNVDTLALYYNKDIFNTNGIPQPPTTWEEFIEVVEKLTIKDERGNIVRAGAAMGTAYNINRSTDILSLLMLQTGSQMIGDNRKSATFNKAVSFEGETYRPGEQALQFYTDFANPLKSIYTYNSRMFYSLDAFSEGEAAMMINYSYHLPTIRAKSPYLNFDVAPVPQIKNSPKSINYANYWGLVVSKNSQNYQAAWQFINWLGQRESAQKYLELAKKPTARRDLVSWQKEDADLGVFAEQSLSAHSWYQVDNQTIEQYLADMIKSVVLGEATIKEAINKAANQVSLLMKK